MLPRDRYKYELEDYNLPFDWTTYGEERRYGYYIDLQTAYIDIPTGAVQIVEKRTREIGWGKPYRTVIGVLASKEVDAKGQPKYRRLVDVGVLVPSDANVRALDAHVRVLIEQQAWVMDRWTYEGAWAWGWSSLPTRARRRIFNFLESRGWYRAWVRH